MPELVKVSLERDGARAMFCVAPGRAADGDILRAMGFRPDEERLVRSFPDSDDIPRVFANFSAHVDEMIGTRAGRSPRRGSTRSRSSQSG